MSKAEERAQDLGYWKDPLNRVEYTANDRWEAFIEGYHQAEKDLELSWEDVSRIRQIMFDYNAILRAKMCIPNDEDYCKEILRRYKENIY